MNTADFVPRSYFVPGHHFELTGTVLLGVVGARAWFLKKSGKITTESSG